MAEEPGSLVGFALLVLATPDAFAKAALTRRALAAWRTGDLPAWLPSDGSAAAKPARDGTLTVVQPGAAPKRGRGGTPESRRALLHALAHTESWAVDLSWDLVARFARQLPAGLDARAFCDDWAVVAEDEAAHFELLAARLAAVGGRFGELPVHDGLWESASRTAHSLAARLAVEHCVHEARGLDVLPQTVARFRAGGDEASAALLEGRILPEEVSHCAKGVAWFRRLHQVQHPGGGEAAAAAAFRQAVADNFRGALKPPFNEAARAAAGFSPDWYLAQPAAAAVSC